MSAILFVADAASIHTQRWLLHYRDKGYRVHVASFVPAIIEGIVVHSLPSGRMGKFGYLRAIPTLRRLHREIRPVLTHAHYLTSYGAISALAGVKPLIVTAWGSDLLVNVQRSVIHRQMTKLALLRADAITVVAEHMIPVVRELVPGVENCLRLIPFGVDTDMFRPEERVQSFDGLRIVCTRFLEPLYDHDTLLRALAVCVSRGLRFHLDLVGDGSLRFSLEALARDLGISKQVSFLGRVSHQELAGMLPGYDVFVTASRSDGNNVSLNEAMASGVFPIASDIPANRQWITDGVDGYIFPVGDSRLLAALLERGFHEPNFRTAVVRNNRVRVERVASWRHFAAKMDSLYAEVIDQSR